MKVEPLALQDAAPVMVWTARPDMSCESVSPQWVEFTGCSEEQALGDGWSSSVHPEDLAHWLDSCIRAFDAREPFEVEYRLRRRDGEYRWVLDRARPRFAAGGLFVGYVGACIDIDERKRGEIGLARALERERRLRVGADETSRLRDGFVASVLRELQPSAQAIATWAAYLVKHLPASSDGRRALEAIGENARAQDRIIRNLLELSSAQPAGRAGGAGEPLLTGVRVLVVEDDPAERETMLKVLGVAGAQTRAAATRTEAVDAVRDWHPDVLLSDLALRGEEAFRLIRELRAMPAERGGCLRAAAIAGERENGLSGRRSAVEAGYDAQLAKPIEPVALLATVARLAQPAIV